MGWEDHLDESEEDDLLADFSDRRSNVIYVIDSDAEGDASTKREYKKAIELANETFVSWGLLDRVEEGRCGFNGWQFMLVGSGYVLNHLEELGDNHQLIVLGRDRVKICEVAAECVDPKWVGNENSGSKPWNAANNTSVARAHLPVNAHNGQRVTQGEGPLQNMGVIFHSDRAATRARVKGQILYDQSFRKDYPPGKNYLLVHLEPINFHYNVAAVLIHELGHTLIHRTDADIDNHDVRYGRIMTYGYANVPDLEEVSDPRKLYQHFTDPAQNRFYIDDAKAWRYTPSNPRLRLLKLECWHADDTFGDETFLVARGQRIWGPVDMDDGDVKELDIELEFGGNVQVALYDDEGSFFEADLLAEHLVEKRERFAGVRTVELGQGGVRYDLTYEVL